MTPRILVVDDDPTFYKLVLHRLTGHAAEVDTADSSTLAWRLLSQQIYQIIIADLEMPGMNGEELIRCIRGHPRTRHLPVIVISAHEKSGPILKAPEAGATSYLNKPVNWPVFDSHIQRHMGMHLQPRQA